MAVARQPAPPRPGQLSGARGHARRVHLRLHGEARSNQASLRDPHLGTTAAGCGDPLARACDRAVTAAGVSLTSRPSSKSLHRRAGTFFRFFPLSEIGVPKMPQAGLPNPIVPYGADETLFVVID